MDVREFIKDDEELKNIDIDNIIKFMDDFQDLKEEYQKKLDEDKFMDDFQDLKEEYQKKLDEDKIKNLKILEERKHKLENILDIITIFKNFENKINILNNYNLFPKEENIYNKIIVKNKELYNLLENLTTEIKQKEK